MKNPLLPLTLTALLWTGCGSVPLTGRRQLLLVSDQEVLTSSLTQYNDYMKTAPRSSSATQAAMVKRVGQKIAQATETYLRQNGLAAEVKNFQWEFNLVADDQVNAFCMPGGKIVVYEGLMKLVTSDDELAVVVGHEVAHAVAKHSNERLSAGYNPDVAVGFWQKMSASGSGSVPELLSTHPSDTRRISDIRKALPEIKAKY